MVKGPRRVRFAAHHLWDQPRFRAALIIAATKRLSATSTRRDQPESRAKGFLFVGGHVSPDGRRNETEICGLRFTVHIFR